MSNKPEIKPPSLTQSGNSATRSCEQLPDVVAGHLSHSGTAIGDAMDAAQVLELLFSSTEDEALLAQVAGECLVSKRRRHVQVPPISRSTIGSQSAGLQFF